MAKKTLPLCTPCRSWRSLRSFDLDFAEADTAEDQQQKIAGCASSYIDRVSTISRMSTIPVGAAAGCDLLILILPKQIPLKINSKRSQAPPAPTLTAYTHNFTDEHNPRRSCRRLRSFDLDFAEADTAEDQQQKIAGFASSYVDRVYPQLHE